MTTPSTASVYPAHLQVDCPEQHNKATTLFRVFLVIPIAVVLGVLTAGGCASRPTHSCWSATATRPSP